MSLPYPVPVGRTARRIAWQHLPAPLRAAIEHRCGSAVLEAESCTSGFTPGLASVLHCEDGSRHFVKAASTVAQRPFADAYREEARKLAALPEGVPAARLLWTIDSDWVVIGLEHIDGRAPRRPWRADELDVCLDELERCAELLTPAPDVLALDTFADEFASVPAMWEQVRDAHIDPAHRHEAARLAAGFAEVTRGQSVVHTDLRDDNVLLTSSGAVFCDWNWPVVGAEWVDTVLMMIGPRGDGLDVDRLLAGRDLTREVPPDHLDSVIALVCGFFWASADQPVPPTSPHLREHQRWQAEVCWGWLSERRGWS